MFVGFTKIFLFFGFFCINNAVKINVDEYGYLKSEAKAETEVQDLSKIPGIPGHDYPIYHSVPDTSFDCNTMPALPGIYANVETGCQAYHICHDGREGHQGSKFLCTNGTLFSQKLFTCDYWYNVDCNEAPQYFRLNADPETNPFTPKKKPEEPHY